MKKNINPKVTLGIAALSYLFSVVIGGIIGDFLGFLGFICLVLGIVGIIQISTKKKNEKR